MFNPLRCLLGLALMLGVATPALADNPVEPAACKAPGAKRVLVGTFEVTRTGLSAYMEAHPFALHPPGIRGNARSAYKRATLADLVAVTRKSTAKARIAGPKHVKIDPPWCGIVDDWHYLALKAHEQCNRPGVGNGNAYFVADPIYTTFNHPTNHHGRLLSSAQHSGDIVLHGNCYVCTSGRSVGTATALPKDQIKAQEPAKGD